MLRFRKVGNLLCRPRTRNYARVNAATFCETRKTPDLTDTKEEQKSKMKVIHEETGNNRNIRAMVFATGVNLFYWGFNSSMTIYDNILANVPFGLDIMRGAELDTFLFVASTFLVGATKLFADHSVMKVYENVHDGRIGFQVHTLLGFPGKCLEVPIGNTTIEDGGEGGMVGVRVVGLRRPLIIPNTDKFRDADELHELLMRKKPVGTVVRKERIGWKVKEPRGIKNIKLQ